MLPWETLANHKPIEMVRSWAHVQSRLLSYHTVGYILLFPWFSLSGWYIPITFIFPWNSPYIPTHSQKHIPIIHIHLHIPIIFYYIPIMFPLYSHYFVPTLLCYFHDIIYSHYITIMYDIYIYIYIHIFPFDCHDIPILYPIISYYIYISSTHYIIEL